MFTPSPNRSNYTEGLHTSVESAFSEWKSGRALLVDALSSYTNASATLQAACASPRHRASQSSMIEDILGYLDSELTSLATMEHNLQALRLSLSSTRNQSLALVPTTRLPNELLIKIFGSTGSSCVRKNDARRYINNFTWVCTHWRQVALDAKELWRHIDVHLHSHNRSAEFSLEHSGGMPIHVHVCSKNKYTQEIEQGAVIATIKPHAHRIRALTIDTLEASEVEIQDILNTWLAQADATLVESLSIHRPKNRENPFCDAMPKDQEMILRSLRVLHLQGGRFNWSSGAYRGLVDLRLDLIENRHLGSISCPQLADVLSANPGLVTLKLVGLSIDCPEGWNPPAPVLLHKLEVLCLFIKDQEIIHVLSLISLPRSSTSLSIGLILFLNTKEMHDAIINFINQVIIATLYLSYRGHHRNISETLGSPSHISTAIFRGIIIREVELVTPNDPPTKRPDHHVSQLIFAGYQVDCPLEKLSKLVLEHGIQSVRFERCPQSEGLLASLANLHPNLECCSSDVDTTAKHPCRTMYD